MTTDTLFIQAFIVLARPSFIVFTRQQFAKPMIEDIKNCCHLYGYQSYSTRLHKHIYYLQINKFANFIAMKRITIEMHSAQPTIVKV